MVALGWMFSKYLSNCLVTKNIHIPFLIPNPHPAPSHWRIIYPSQKMPLHTCLCLGCFIGLHALFAPVTSDLSSKSPPLRVLQSHDFFVDPLPHSPSTAVFVFHFDWTLWWLLSFSVSLWVTHGLHSARCCQSQDIISYYYWKTTSSEKFRELSRVTQLIKKAELAPEVRSSSFKCSLVFPCTSYHNWWGKTRLL